MVSGAPVTAHPAHRTRVLDTEQVFGHHRPVTRSTTPPAPSTTQRSLDDLGTPLHDVTFCVVENMLPMIAAMPAAAVSTLRSFFVCPLRSSGPGVWPD